MISPLALPRLDSQAAAATSSAVAAGMNGVDPGLRRYALRKLRAAVRRGSVSPKAVARAVQRGDAGLASLFPVQHLKPAPKLTAASATATVQVQGIDRIVAESRWFIELAVRRGCAPDGVLEVLADSSSAPHRVGMLLVRTWNALMESYRPDWLPDLPDGERPKLLALPASLSADRYAEDAFSGDPLLYVEPQAISRLFVRCDGPDYPILHKALSTLDEAITFGLAGCNPMHGRECYMEYAGGELHEDLRQHLTWPDGAAEPVANLDAVADLLDDLGYDRDDAEHYAQMAIGQAVLMRKLKEDISQVDLDTQPSTQDSDMVKAARKIMELARCLQAMPEGRKKLECQVNGVGLAVMMIATTDNDPLYHDLMMAVDMECQEDNVYLQVFAQDISMPELDRQLQRMVAQMVVAEYVYQLVYEVS